MILFKEESKPERLGQMFLWCFFSLTPNRGLLLLVYNKLLFQNQELLRGHPLPTRENPPSRKGTVEKVPCTLSQTGLRNRRKEIIVGTALVAVLHRVRTGIHPEGLILKDKPCPYIKTSP